MTQVARPSTRPPAKGENQAPLASDALASQLVALILANRRAPSRERMAREARRILSSLEVEAAQ